MKVALLQMTSGIDLEANAASLEKAVGEAAVAGAVMLFTPEMSSLLDRDGKRARAKLSVEAEDQVLRRVRAAASAAGLWVSLGSLALSDEADGSRLANRGFLIGPRGEIVARYNKMHLFDVDLPTGESWRESARYEAGETPMVANTPLGRLGLSICYDLRFPMLYQQLSVAGAQVLAVPAAFTVPTGAAHWHVLLRARAIENAAFVIAAAQVGHHEDGRRTYGHSLVVNPWGDVLLDMSEAAGLGFCDLDLAQVDAVRSRVPVIAHRRAIPAVVAS